MSVNFLGLNSQFDSSSLISQLIQLETQSKVTPLQNKKQSLNNEKTFLTSVESNISNLRTTLKIDEIGDATETLFPKSITSSDKDEKFVTVTAESNAVNQSFALNVTQLATSTVRESSSSLSLGVTGASILNTASFKGGAALSGGSVTINGETQTYTVDTAVDDVNSMLNFLNSFTGITATLEASGQVKLTGVTNLGGAGDTSNLVSGLGLNNAQVVAGEVTGLQNIDAANGNTLLTNMGITGTTLTINGEDITFDPATDSINDLLDTINTTANTKVSANYDALNGRFILTNKDTGSLSLTLSSSDSNIVSQLNLSSETLGDNAEFTISTLNGGATLVSNSNTVTGLVEGLTLELKEVTTAPVNISLSDNKTAYKDRVKSILKEVSGIIRGLEIDGTSFSRGLSRNLRNAVSTFFSGSTNDTFKSGIELGIKTSLNAENKFSEFTLDESIFDAALDRDPDAVSTVLFGNSTGSINTLDDGSFGIFVLLNDVLETYVNPNVATNGIINQVKSSIDSQVSSADKAIERAENSIQALEDRLRRQFSQLDVINAEFANQQAAVSALFT